MPSGKKKTVQPPAEPRTAEASLGHAPEATVVLVGLPNVGKSALFNRLTGQRRALVFDCPGVTRDCFSVSCILPGGQTVLRLVDTPGLFAPSEGGITKEQKQLENMMLEKALEIAKTADLLIFVFDGKEADVQTQLDFFQKIRKLNKTLLTVANKSDAWKGAGFSPDFYKAGLQPLPLSAEHNVGIDSLVSEIENLLVPKSEQKNQEKKEAFAEPAAEKEGEKEQDAVCRVSILGRPNVGKSTLINAFLQRQAQMVADFPGVTRDTVDFDWEYQGRRFQLSDTAGIRRRSKIQDQLEKLSVSKALSSVRTAHLCVLVVDASELEKTDFGEFLKQDMLLAGRILEEGRGLLLALNKWDLVQDKPYFKQNLQNSLVAVLSETKDIPLLPLSAVQGRGLKDLLKALLVVEGQLKKHIKTPQLNRWLQDVTQRKPPPLSHLRRSKLKYMTQIGTCPPSFLLFGTKIQDIPESYRRFLINQLRQAFGLQGIPLRLQWRQQENPYAKKSHKPRVHTAPQRHKRTASQAKRSSPR
ncbi:GTPase Der [Alphaproteobacteria bacterium]|nr:GTPase Der [Alphaproteobacteria bacterium]GHS97169.1 GTPase Der [Alphaproteobacteria bacterium]